MSFPNVQGNLATALSLPTAPTALFQLMSIYSPLAARTLPVSKNLCEAFRQFTRRGLEYDRKSLDGIKRSSGR